MDDEQRERVVDALKCAARQLQRWRNGDKRKRLDFDRELAISVTLGALRELDERVWAEAVSK